MRIRVDNSRAGVAGVMALAGVALAACGHQEPQVADIRPKELDGGRVASRQVAVRVSTDGSVAWEGRAVSEEELASLMRQAALGPKLLLVVVPVSDQVGYGKLVEVAQMASTYGIEAKIAKTGGIAE